MTDVEKAQAANAGAGPSNAYGTGGYGGANAYGGRGCVVANPAAL